MTDVELLATDLENAEDVIDKLSDKITERDAVLKEALQAMGRIKGYGNTFLYRRNEQSPYEQTCEAIEAIEKVLR